MVLSVSDIYDLKYDKEMYEEYYDLKDYLMDILSSIEEELIIDIKKDYNETDSWRKRKNPNFMSKYNSEDKILLNINCEINKITSKNYKSIIENVNKIIDKIEDIPKYKSYIYDNIYNKCLIQPSYINEYTLFLININKLSLIDNIKDDICKFTDLLNEDGDTINMNNKLIESIYNDKEKAKNLGIYFGSLYINNIINTNNIIMPLLNFIKFMSNLLEWMPIDMKLYNMCVNVLSGYFMTIYKKLWDEIDIDTKRDFVSSLNVLADNSNLELKDKFEIMNLLDSISDYNRSKIKKRDTSYSNNRRYNNDRGDYNRQYNNERRQHNKRRNRNNKKRS